jgi:hypothetical protein
MDYYQDEEEGDDVDGPDDYDSPRRQGYPTELNTQQDGGVPSIQATAHKQLLASQGAEVSGKRSGRDLVRNLESLAEMQGEKDEQVSAPRSSWR